MTLVPINTDVVARQSQAIQELAISGYLEQARDWLATAVEMTGPEQVAAAKAQIATAAEATKQLGLSKEIQLDAQEMVRRAEYALGKAIRKGQEEGTVLTQADGAFVRDLGAEVTKVSVRDLVPESNRTRGQIYEMSDDVAPEQFDAALAEAKDEGDMARTNVIRKIRKQACDRGPSRADRADIIRDLASKGWTSEQMRKEVGYSTASQVRELAREFDIQIPADIVRGRSRRIDHMRVLDNVSEAVEVAAMSLRDIDVTQLAEEEALERLDSLTTSINAIAKAVKKIKESFHD